MSYTIRVASREEWDLVVDWAAKEGWNPGLHETDSFYASDPQGFLLGFLDHEPIASISVVAYAAQFGFLGFYIVKPEYRGNGYGLALWKEALKHLPSQNIGLDGVIAQQENYKKAGFQLAYRHIRYAGVGSATGENYPEVMLLNDLSFGQLRAYDDRLFPASRPAFLQSWIRQPESLAIGFLHEGTLMGYGVVRKCRNGYKIGPLFADTQAIAHALFQKMRTFVGAATPIVLDIPEVNESAIALAETYSMKPVFETARMYTRGAPSVPLHKVFGVTTFELG